MRERVLQKETTYRGGWQRSSGVSVTLRSSYVTSTKAQTHKCKCEMCYLHHTSCLGTHFKFAPIDNGLKIWNCATGRYFSSHCTIVLPPRRVRAAFRPSLSNLSRLYCTIHNWEACRDLLHRATLFFQIARSCESKAFYPRMWYESLLGYD